MTPTRSLFIALMAVVVLIGARPIAGVEQFPHGLLSAEPKASYCTIQTRPLSFGVYDPLTGTDLDGVGQVIYLCGSGHPGGERVAKNIRIEMSRGYTNSYSDRAMVGPSFSNLHYNIYLDATHRTIWGDGTSGTEYYFDAKPPNGAPVTVPAFGRIAPRQDVESGEYVDQLTVTIVF